jgi:two-component system response regulator SaeR
MPSVLIVDDNFDDLSSMKAVLEGKGFKVSTATNGAQAIDAISSHKFDVFLVDVMMPTLSGYDLVRLLRAKQNGGAKIVFVSIVPRQEVTPSDVNGFIQKPFSPAGLVSEVKRVLGDGNGKKNSSKKK